MSGAGGARTHDRRIMSPLLRGSHGSGSVLTCSNEPARQLPDRRELHQNCNHGSLPTLVPGPSSGVQQQTIAGAGMRLSLAWREARRHPWRRCQPGATSTSQAVHTSGGTPHTYRTRSQPSDLASHAGGQSQVGTRRLPRIGRVHSRRPRAKRSKVPGLNIEPVAHTDHRTGDQDRPSAFRRSRRPDPGTSRQRRCLPTCASGRG